MDALYQGILDLLNGLIPSAQLATYAFMNELLAYILTITLVYAFILKPVLKITKIIKK